MKITDNNIGNQTYASQMGKKTSLRAKGTANPQGVKKDTVSLSDNSKEIQLAKFSAQTEKVNSSETPERREKVDALKLAVENGQYMVNANKTAEKIIGFSLDQYT